MIIINFLFKMVKKNKTNKIDDIILFEFIEKNKKYSLQKIGEIKNLKNVDIILTQKNKVIIVAEDYLYIYIYNIYNFVSKENYSLEKNKKSFK